MKFRSVVIILLVALLVFALVACKQPDPEPEVNTTIYKLTATKGRNNGWWSYDKFVLAFNGDDSEVVVNKGDVLTLKYRSTREITQFNIRNDNKWIYEQPGSNGALPEGFLSEPDADGWITVTFTFGDYYYNGTTPAVYPNMFRFDFIGEIVSGDVLEVKEIKLNNTYLTLTADMVAGYASPTFEEAADSSWQNGSDWVVFYFYGTPGSVDKEPMFERVLNNGTITGTVLAKEHYSYALYTDDTFTTPFDATTPITHNTRLYYQYTGDPTAVTFSVPEGATTVEAQTVAYGAHATKPAEDPTMADKLFVNWYADAEFNTVFDFANTAITAATTIYAKFETPLSVTFNAQNETDPSVVPVLSGSPVAKPADPTNGSKVFIGWFLEAAEAAYDFTTPVTEDITLFAHWVESVNVTLNPNYEGAETSTVPAGLDIAMDAPEDPVRDGWVFDKWTTDAEGEHAYDFATVVTDAFTLYAQWLAPVTVTFNANGGTFPVEGTPATVTATVGTGKAVAAPETAPTLTFSFFDKWTTDAEGEHAYDFDTPVDAEITLYAQWTHGDLYQLVSSKTRVDYDTDKFTIKYSDGKVNAGDVLSFRFRTTADLTKFSIRGAKKWVYENSTATRGMTTYETLPDGWTYVTYVFSARTYDDSADIPADAWWRFDFCSDTIVKGDVLEIQGWALNNEPLAIEAANVTDYVAPSVEIVDEYDWDDLTVNYVMGENAAAIADDTVEFGHTLAAPAVTPNDGYAFAGWYTDAECTKAYDFALPVIKDLTLYAKIDVAKVLSFDSQEGSAVAPINTAVGVAIAEPDEPTRLGYIFGGWYTEAGCENAFDFAAGIEENTTVFAKWIAANVVTLNANGGTLATTTIYAESGKAMAAPDVHIGKAGYFFGGWYDDEGCTAAHDFTAPVNADTTIYAKWNAPTKKYVYTATTSHERFQWRFKVDNVAMLDGAEPGDVITFQVKFTTATVTPSTYRVRTYQDESELSGGKQSFGAPEDGWYSVTVTVPESGTFVGKTGLYLQLFASASWAIGDVCEIKALAYNGVEIPISTSSTSNGLYPGISATVEAVNL